MVWRREVLTWEILRSWRPPPRPLISPKTCKDPFRLSLILVKEQSAEGAALRTLPELRPRTAEKGGPQADACFNLPNTCYLFGQAVL